MTHFAVTQGCSASGGGSTPPLAIIGNQNTGGNSTTRENRVSYFNEVHDNDIQQLVANQNSLYFTATDGLYGSDLYFSDGVNVQKAPKTYPYGADNPALLTLGEDGVYYVSYDHSGHTKLHYFDGNTATLVHDFNPGQSDRILNLKFSNGVLFVHLENFTGANIDKLFAYRNHTMNQITDLNPGNPDRILNLIPVGDVAIIEVGFGGNDNIRKLFRAQIGSPASQVSDTSGSSGKTDSPNGITAIGRRVYFSAYNGVDLNKTYIYDVDTQILQTIPETNHSTNPLDGDEAASFVEMSGFIYYSSLDQNGFRRIFRYNGTQVSLIPNPDAVDYTDANGLTVGNGQLYFIGSVNGLAQDSMFKFDGNRISHLGNTNTPSTYDGAQILKFANGQLYFTSLKSFRTKLFNYDGIQVSQTVDLFPLGDDSVRAITNFNNKIFASITIQDANTRLFDLSTSPAKIISNTSLAGDDSISQWAAGSQVAYLVASTGKSDTNGALIRKLYLFDGNQFQKLPDIIGPNFDDNPNSLVVVGDDLFFIAGAAGSNFPHVYFYRRSTGQVSQISNISNDENPRDLKWLNGSLYFKAFTNFTMEVDHYYRWNNGSLSMVSDTCPGHKSDVSNLSAFGSFICFTAKKTAGASCTNYSRLYCTSGTQTVLAGNDVSDGGLGITDPRQLTSSNGNLYMIAYNQSKSHIYKWTGTGQISQLSHVNTQTNDDQISSIATFGNDIIFSAIPQGTTDARIYRSNGSTVTPLSMTPPGSSAIKFESTGITISGNYYFVGSPVGSNCNQVYRYNGSNIELMIHPFPSLCKKVNMFDQANSRLLISMSDNQGNGRLYRSTDGLNLQLVSGLNPTNEDIAEKGFQLGSNYFYVPNLTTGTSLFKIQNE